MKVGREQVRRRRTESQRWFLGNGKLLLLLLLCSFDRSPFTRDLGELLGALAIYNEGGTQPVECNFDIWISDGLKSGVDGLDKICHSPVWTLVSIFYPLLLEIPTDLATVRSQNIFQDTFGQLPKRQFSLFFNMSQLSTTAKTTFIYLSALTGVNLILILSSDPTTVVVGFACLILSLSSLASFYIDQVMLDQSHI